MICTRKKLNQIPQCNAITGVGTVAAKIVPLTISHIQHFIIASPFSNIYHSLTKYITEIIYRMLQNELATSTVLSREELAQREKDIAEHSSSIIYSKRYSDDQYEYRHVILPKPLSKWVPQGRLMSEDDWRGLGVTQSPGWVHYMIHLPEPHILLFRRDREYQAKYPPAA